MSTLARLSHCGVIGDVHCETETLGRVLDALESMHVDPVLCVGDLVDGDGDADATLGLLEGRRVQCVAGNHERWFLAGEQRTLDHATQEINGESLAFVRSLPRVRNFQTPNGKALLCHGVGEADEAWLLPDTKGYALQDIPTLRELMLDDDVQFMIGGHTHERMIRVFPGLTVVNTGTIHRRNQQTFTVIDFEKMRVAHYSAAPDNTGELLEEAELPTPPPVN